MKMYFKQRLFSWLDSYDIFDENGNTIYTVESQLSWGHCLHILDASGHDIGVVKEQILTIMPRFAIYADGEQIGMIYRNFTFLHPSYTIDFNNKTFLYTNHTIAYSYSWKGDVGSMGACTLNFNTNASTKDCEDTTLSTIKDVKTYLQMELYYCGLSLDDLQAEAK